MLTISQTQSPYNLTIRRPWCVFNVAYGIRHDIMSIRPNGLCLLLRASSAFLHAAGAPGKALVLVRPPQTVPLVSACQAQYSSASAQPQPALEERVRLSESCVKVRGHGRLTRAQQQGKRLARLLQWSEMSKVCV